jgi:SAM-dependent methyltransferase
MDIQQYRASTSEKLRTDDLLRLIPESGQAALDVGARDGHFSRLIADRFTEVTALDLNCPQIDHPRVKCVKGDITHLDFPDGAFDFVLCAEVLEHIPPALLMQACSELARVTRGLLLIGVPYQQDIRVGRTRCRSCGKHNPPWGHVNAFDELHLRSLFPDLAIVEQNYVGETRERTNMFSAWLMDLAGNPYGTYEQDELCIHCGKKLIPPTGRNLVQRVLTRVAAILIAVQNVMTPIRPQWIHVLFRKNLGTQE